MLVPTAHSMAQRSWFESKSTSNSNRNIDNTSWSDKLTGAVQRTVIISEILDSRTRQLVQVAARLIVYIHKCNECCRIASAMCGLCMSPTHMYPMSFDTWARLLPTECI